MTKRIESFEPELKKDQYLRLVKELESKGFVFAKENHKPLFQSGGFWFHPGVNKGKLYSGKQLSQDRFILIEDRPEFPIKKEGSVFDSAWYWDLNRVGGGPQPFVAVQCRLAKNPNDRVEYDELFLLYTDQAEYYAVCSECRVIYGDLQWSGSTMAFNWRKASQEYLMNHLREKGWCEFCDPAFGNGGWRLD